MRLRGRAGERTRAKNAKTNFSIHFDSNFSNKVSPRSAPPLPRSDQMANEKSINYFPLAFYNNVRGSVGRWCSGVASREAEEVCVWRINQRKHSGSNRALAEYR